MTDDGGRRTVRRCVDGPAFRFLLSTFYFSPRGQWVGRLPPRQFAGRLQVKGSNAYPVESRFICTDGGSPDFIGLWRSCILMSCAKMLLRESTGEALGV
jgi:hypothetical protein